MQLVSAMQEIQVRSLGQEDSPGEGNGYPFQYSFLENPTDSLIHFNIQSIKIFTVSQVRNFGSLRDCKFHFETFCIVISGPLPIQFISKNLPFIILLQSLILLAGSEMSRDQEKDFSSKVISLRADECQRLNKYPYSPSHQRFYLAVTF